MPRYGAQDLSVLAVSGGLVESLLSRRSGLSCLRRLRYLPNGWCELEFCAASVRQEGGRGYRLKVFGDDVQAVDFTEDKRVNTW